MTIINIIILASLLLALLDFSCDLWTLDEMVSGLVAALHLLPFSAWLLQLVFFAKRWCENMDLATVLEIRVRDTT